MSKLLIIFSLYLPFQLALNPARNIDLASIRVFILALFFIWLMEGLRKGQVIFKDNLQTALVATFLFLNTISVFQAKNTDWSGRKLLFLFSVFPLYFVVYNVIKNKEGLLRLVKALVFGGVAVGMVGIFQFALQFFLGLEKTYQLWADYIAIPFLGKSFGEAVLKNPSWLVNISGHTYMRATATFPDPHMFSFFLGLLIPLSLGLFLETRKGGFFFSLAVLSLADILTFSRGGYLGLFFGALSLVVFFWKEIGKKHKLISAGIVSLIILVLVVPSPISQRFFSSFNLKEGSNKGRIETWNKALEVVKDEPLTGVGIGNYPLEIKPTADYREPIYAHNTYLDIAAETGLPNALVWISLLLSTVLVFLKRREVFSMCLMASVIVFSVHSSVETAIYSPVVMSVFLIVVSLSNFEERKNEKMA